MSTQEMDRDVIDRPVVNSWSVAPSERQKAYAAALCRSELSYADRLATIKRLDGLDCAAVSDVITRLEKVRSERMARLRRTVHGRRR